MLARRPTTTVLVVEDDRALRDLYRSVLREAGFTVVAVGDGLDALHVLEQRVPALVVLDLALTRLSGRDVGQELRATAATRHVPIVVVTGKDDENAENLDVDCVLRKPVAPERLVETVNRCLLKATVA